MEEEILSLRIHSSEEFSLPKTPPAEQEVSVLIAPPTIEELATSLTGLDSDGKIFGYSIGDERIPKKIRFVLSRLHFPLLSVEYRSAMFQLLHAREERLKNYSSLGYFQDNDATGSKKKNSTFFSFFLFLCMKNSS